MPGAHDGPPFFSVIVPTFNRPQFVVRAIGSVLDQSFPDFELIVADDGSSLDYAPAMEPFANDRRVRFVSSGRNRGAGAARNLGISHAKGEYIAFLDDDDEYLPSFLQQTYETLKSADSDRQLSFCGVQWLNDAPSAADRRPTRTLEFETSYADEISLLETFLSIGTGYGFCLSAGSVRDVGGFNETLRTTEDTELFLRIVEKGYRPTVTPGVHVSIHDHHGHRLTGEEMFGANIREIKWLLASFGPLFSRYPSLETQLIAHMNYLSGLLEQSSAVDGSLA